MLPTSLLAEKAGQSLKVIFTGEGGDEAFAGYARYRKHPLQRLLSNLVRPGVGGFRTRNRWPAELRQHAYSPRLQAVVQRLPASRRSMPGGARRTAWSDLQRAAVLRPGRARCPTSCWSRWTAA